MSNNPEQRRTHNTRHSSRWNSHSPIEELTEFVNYNPTTNTLNLDLFALLAPETAESNIIPPSPDLPAPQLTDAILGDRTPPPVNSLVSGGIDGVRCKLQQSGQSNDYYHTAAIASALETIALMRSKLPDDVKQDLLQDLNLLPGWMALIAKNVCSDADLAV
jgi:hypothetical protein